LRKDPVKGLLQIILVPGIIGDSLYFINLAQKIVVKGILQIDIVQSSLVLLQVYAYLLQVLLTEPFLFEQLQQFQVLILKYLYLPFDLSQQCIVFLVVGGFDAFLYFFDVACNFVQDGLWHS